MNSKVCPQRSYHSRHSLSSSAVWISEHSLWNAVELLHCDELHLFNLAPWGLPGLFLLQGDLFAGSCHLSSSEKPKGKQPRYSTDLNWYSSTLFYTTHTKKIINKNMYCWSHGVHGGIILISAWAYGAVGCPPLRGMCGGMFFNRCCAFCSSSWKNMSRSCIGEKIPYIYSIW